jgi:hypothetical protein
MGKRNKVMCSTLSGIGSPSLAWVRTTKTGMARYHSMHDFDHYALMCMFAAQEFRNDDARELMKQAAKHWRHLAQLQRSIRAAYSDGQAHLRALASE